ncbi:hypothetical protein ICU97_04485 [Bacillus sp. 2211]|uniref:hypothetical protein n=1 Tax=Bacillus TaxID=1386 RepID=UPI00165F1222|nr:MULTISPECIES: hypothetical protein [Bacillus]MBD0396888.1 hypothetical protein [Bacillus sp. 2211]
MLMEIENIEELPIQKFYFSMSHLSHISQVQDNLPSLLIRDLYSIVDTYYLESLSILRSSKKNGSRLKFEIGSKLKESREMLEKYQRLREQTNDPDELEWVNVIQSRHMSEREFKLKQIELEGEMNSLASIVMFLSLLESTLFSLTKKLIESEPSLPEMKDVMNRSDNGIVKYLKYFEKYIEKQEKHFIVGTKKYELIRFWLNVRNNIVHSNNAVKKEILSDANRLKISISINSYSNKFRFKDIDIMSVAELCGGTLEDCIEKGLYKYFGVEDF